MKKAFTLIELLAVIIILGVVSVIAVPTIIDVVKDSKESVNNSLIHSYLDKARNYYAESMFDESKLSKMDGTTNLMSELGINDINISKGAIYMNRAGNVALAIAYNDKCYTKYFDTNIFENDDIENCGTNNEFTKSSHYISFGGEYIDDYTDIITTSDNNFIAVGVTNSKSYNGLTGHGTDINDDVIVVKYNSNGEILWNKNFGGSKKDSIKSVIEEDDCYTIYGVSYSNDGDFTDITNNDTFESMYIFKINKNTGDIISKKIIFSSNNNKSYQLESLMRIGEHYYVFVSGNYIVPDQSMCLAYIIKYDINFNQVWIKSYNGRYSSSNLRMLKTSNNTLLISTSEWNNEALGGEVSDIIIPGVGNTFDCLFEISMEDGTLINQTSIGGGGSSYTQINSLLEVDDGYIISGYSNANDGNFLNLNNGLYDGFVAKIGKIPNANDILPIIWVKTFGGSEDDYFSNAIIDNNKIYLVGSSRSSNKDLLNIVLSNNNYSDGIILEYDLNGNLLNKKSLGGTNGDVINSITKYSDKFLILGNTFSTDINFDAFNYGNNDAFVMTLDNNFNLVQSFNQHPLLLNKLPNIIKNYGTTIPQPSGASSLNLYTTNDPRRDLKNWCTQYTHLDPNRNYDYVNCLKPFNSSDSKILYRDTFSLENEFSLNYSNNNWLKLYLSFGNGGYDHGISNLKVKFQDDEYMTIEASVNKGYIEPLVLVGQTSGGNYFFENSFNLITTGTTDGASYPFVTILFKPKKKLESIIFNSKKATTMLRANYYVQEFINFDISLTPTN